MDPLPAEATKTYPPRGPLQQVRFAASTAFECFRCGRSTKSKLITVYGGEWSKRLCNGCYGRLLSLYEIKAGTSPDDERAEKLADALLSMAAADDVRRVQERMLAAEKRANLLCSESLRFIATAEHVAGALSSEPQLEWSPAVIGLCKAVEAEVVERVIRPLAEPCTELDLSADKRGKDVGRVASYCADTGRKPPELGAFAHCPQTVIHSKERRETSPLLGVFPGLASNWTGSGWVLDPDGCYSALVLLCAEFRNKAAHTEELDQAEYKCCRDLTIGSDGPIWRLVLATKEHA